MSSRLMIFGALVCLAVFVVPLVPIHPVIAWTAALIIAALAAATAHPLSGRAQWFPRGGEFLCDSCKYNDSRYCSRPERPNARKCPDYKLQG